jgi:hypothetical protein
MSWDDDGYLALITGILHVLLIRGKIEFWNMVLKTK